jgi:4-amino-4-deoxy-L-arabinose transferase-like glycosyltransferase
LQCVICLLVVHAVWLGWSATWQSPTLNEPGHLASGIAHWTLGRFEPYAVNPPLVRMVAAVPVLAAGYESDWSSLRGRPAERAEFILGSNFIKANADRSQRLFELARWACIPFSVIGAWMCYVWGRALYGESAGLLACALWCIEPNIIGHGQLITPDVAATSFGLVAMWTFWQWLNRPGWVTATVAGVGLAAAILAKFSWLVLFGLWPVLWTGVWLRSPAPPKKPGLLRAATQLAAMAVTAIYLINLAYAFNGSFSRLRSFEFASQTLSGQSSPTQVGNRFSDSWVGQIPVPAPRQFLLGLDLQKRDFERFPHQSYLRGEWRQGGWWYYYLYAAAVKLPVGLWLLGLTAIVARWRRGGGSSEQTVGELVLLVPSLLLFVIVSSELEFNHHFRYVLPCFGPAFVLISGAIVGAGKWLRIWITANCGWIAIASAVAAPHSLSYFNELAGGMRNGGAHLLHSNVDWGQDLATLKEWMAFHSDARPVYLAYYGFYDPHAYGLHTEEPPQGPFWNPRPSDWSFKPGYYAISVNYLHGTEWRLQNRHAYEPLLKETSVAWCGGSIAIYRVDKHLAKMLTEAVTARMDAK